MKLKTILILTITAILIGVVTVVGVNPVYEKVLEYNGHRIKYGQYLRQELFSYIGDCPTNEALADQAHMKLANNLLDEYLQTKDSRLIVEVLRLSNFHNLRYPNRRHKMTDVDIDSLIRNRNTILDTTIWIIDVN